MQLKSHATYTKWRSERGLNSRPSACKADVITTTPQDQVSEWGPQTNCQLFSSNFFAWWEEIKCGIIWDAQSYYPSADGIIKTSPQWISKGYNCQDFYWVKHLNRALFQLQIGLIINTSHLIATMIESPFPLQTGILSSLLSSTTGFKWGGKLTGTFSLVFGFLSNEFFSWFHLLMAANE